MKATCSTCITALFDWILDEAGLQVFADYPALMLLGSRASSCLAMGLRVEGAAEGQCSSLGRVLCGLPLPRDDEGAQLQGLGNGLFEAQSISIGCMWVHVMSLALQTAQFSSPALCYSVAVMYVLWNLLNQTYSWVMPQHMYIPCCISCLIPYVNVAWTPALQARSCPAAI